MVSSCIGRFLETPALLIRMSIWNLEVLGWEKWFFAVFIWGSMLAVVLGIRLDNEMVSRGELRY